jgi:hypothetical protein
VLTADGVRIAVFYAKACNRLLLPLTAADQPQAPPELGAALKPITACVDNYAAQARLPPRHRENLAQPCGVPKLCRGS